MANPVNTETCHGIGEGASSPPTILDPLVNIQDGMFAEKLFLFSLNVQNINNYTLLFSLISKNCEICKNIFLK